MIEQAKLTYSPLEKAFENKKKRFRLTKITFSFLNFETRRKSAKPKLTEENFSKELENNEIKNEWDEIKKLEGKIDRNGQ